MHLYDLTQGAQVRNKMHEFIEAATSMMQTDVHDYLDELREELGLTQEELKEKSTEIYADPEHAHLYMITARMLTLEQFKGFLGRAVDLSDTSHQDIINEVNEFKSVFKADKYKPMVAAEEYIKDDCSLVMSKSEEGRIATEKTAWKQYKAITSIFEAVCSVNKQPGFHTDTCDTNKFIDENLRLLNAYETKKPSEGKDYEVLTI